jgi:RND family efflux transporter MFP subunit
LDKKALLDELKIDRNAPQTKQTSPFKWLFIILILAGVGYGGWYLGAPRTAQALEVQTILAQAPSTETPESSVLDATGYVIARRQATVSSKATGKVLEVLVEEGMVVEEGQLLAVLDDSINQAQLALAESQIEAANAAIAELEVQIRQAVLDLDRTRQLADANLISQADLDSNALSVEALRARLNKFNTDVSVAHRSMAIQQQFVDDMQIRAPFGGVVIAKAAQPGEMISPVAAGGGFTNTGICTIVDMDSLEIEVDVNEAYINRVSAGQPATVTLNAYPDYVMQAEVIAIIPAANRNQATVRVRVGFLERDDRVLPEMAVKVSFLEDKLVQESVSELPEGVLVPRLAIKENGSASYVWVISNQQANRRQVVLGNTMGQQVLIVSGLASGERVISNFNDELLASLEDGLPVNVLN